jgi:hypothetical protein
MSYQMREAQSKKRKGPNPVWRGIGCLLMVVFIVGGYWLTGVLVRAYRAGAWPNLPRLPIPMNDIPVGPFIVPVSKAVIPIEFTINPAQLMLTLVVMIVGFGLMALVWGIVNPVKPGPLDAPPIHRKIDKSKVR